MAKAKPLVPENPIQVDLTPTQVSGLLRLFDIVIEDLGTDEPIFDEDDQGLVESVRWKLISDKPFYILCTSRKEIEQVMDKCRDFKLTKDKTLKVPAHQTLDLSDGSELNVVSPEIWGYRCILTFTPYKTNLVALPLFMDTIVTKEEILAKVMTAHTFVNLKELPYAGN